MLRLRFDLADLAATRFAISPLSELIAGLRALRQPEAIPTHGPWLRQALPLARELRLQPLLALTPPSGYVPDFLTPPPDAPVATFAAELATVRRTPPAIVRRELAHAFRGRPMPASVQAFASGPRAGLARLCALLEAWWERALAPHWPRIRAVLEADVAHRARQLTGGGAAALFAGLHPEVRWRAGRLELGTRFDADLELRGGGLLLVPSAFWRGLGPIVYPPWQPTLFYPARGVELLWAPSAPAPDALARVLGRTRARLLALLAAPRATTELARQLRLSPGAVSQHLTALRAAGLVTAARSGREVLYLRTEPAERLLPRQVDG